MLELEPVSPNDPARAIYLFHRDLSERGKQLCRHIVAID